MFTGKKVLIILIVLSIMVAGVFFTFRAGINTSDNPESTPDKQTGTYRELKGARLTLYSKSKDIRLEVSSSNVTNRDNNKTIDMTGIEVKVRDNKTEELLYTFSGQNGLYLADRGELRVSGPVVLQKDMITLNSGSLCWKENSDIITGKGGVKLDLPRFTIEGDKMEAAPGSGLVMIHGNQGKQARLTWKEESHASQKN
ncbi:LPS export ABC transporter periplasmic protein LptC [Halothermothrix orenii]|uniref:LPS export ABC transporter periplasmic protein LptC n=1 Tax=Halothermothrix orenii (strain H 168 / OCM 544 / DSM 9562) TaxID=373903 RepID=B8CYY2_HALOH|nr:LPS export ABC transporter periplasmic protein LptC [Halothermothrix orenii]ACL70501.1 Protein of unknown function (DUF1239) [Halothermothrix orenii H 168]